jgi:hypothetical protein
MVLRSRLTHDQELEILVAEGEKKDQEYQRIREYLKQKAIWENTYVPRGWYLEDGKPRNKDVEAVIGWYDELDSFLESSRQGLTKEEWDEGIKSTFQSMDKTLVILEKYRQSASNQDS